MRKDNESRWYEIFEDEFFKKYYKPQAISRPSDERSRLIELLEKANKFFATYQREPEKSGREVNETECYYILSGLRSNKANAAMVQEFDVHKLLQPIEEKEIKSIDDILDDDIFNILDNDAESIFSLTHVSSVREIAERDSADFIAQRRQCKHFEKYKQLFESCQEDIKEGRRKIIKFREGNLVPGSFSVLGGILVYYEKIGKTYKDKAGKIDGRTHTIFENGMESNLLFRSLIKGLFENGFSVTENRDKIGQKFVEEMSGITGDDIESGYIYILKSRSSDLRIAEIQNLYKIGFSATSVEGRIKNAEFEPTYLMAPVDVIATCRCYNMNPQKFEQIIHNLFGNSCLGIDVFDKFSKRHTPREWFIVPLPVIQEAIDLIVSGHIVGCKYDPKLEEITRT
jgi:hypothetical protein